MPSERIRQRIEWLLERADAAADAQDWPAVGDLAARVLALDPDHEDAVALRAMAQAGEGRTSQSAPAEVPASYTAAHLADHVRRIRHEVVGERRVVTVLFADAEGFTSSSERVDEELVYGFMQRCLAVMTAAVHAHDGTVTQFRGDGIMALFGAPIAQENAAVKAVLAALHMRDRLAAVVDGGESGIDCRFRIGLNTGPVVVGSISDDLQMDFTAIGDTVNLAARMEQHAEPGSVWMTDTTRRAVEGFVVCRPKGDISVKGRTQPVAGYEALAPSGAATRFEAAMARGLHPFVGREHDLAVLAALADRARSHSTAVVLVGDAGVGKSRLLLELRNRLQGSTTWLQAQCSNSGRDSPLLPLADLCRSWLGVDHETSLEAIKGRLVSRSAEWPEDRSHLLPVARFLLGLDAPELSGVDSAAFQALVVDVLELVLNVERGGLLIWAVEDVHWIDEASAMVLTLLLDRLPPSVLVLLTARPGGDRSRDAPDGLTRLVLEPLGDEDAARLAASSIGTDALAAPVRSLIVERAGGNALFVEEFAQSLAQTGVIDPATGAVAADVALSDVATPTTVHDVILARIDRLAQESRAALQLASVIGREFTVRLLDRVVHDRNLEASLGHLRTVELIRLVATVPELAYMFKHALVHDVAYGTLLQERRRQLHSQVAHAISALYADRLGQYDAELARHFEAADEWEHAIPHLAALALRSVRAGDADAALAAVERMDVTAARLADPRIELRALETRATVNINAWRLSDALAAWHRYRERAAALGDEHSVAQALTAESFVLLEAHDQSRADAAALEAVRLGRAVGDPDTLAGALVMRAAVLGMSGRRLDSENLLADASAVVAEHDVGPATHTLHRMCSALFAHWRADYAQGRASADALERAGPQWGPVDPTVYASWMAVLASVGHGDFEPALARGQRLAQHLARMGDYPFRGRVLNSVGWAYFEVLDLDEAQRWNERCLDMLHLAEMPDPEIEANARLNLADIHLERVELDQARTQLDWVEGVIDNPGPTDWYALWRYTLHWRAAGARLGLMEGDLERAEQQAHRLVADADETLSRKYQAIGHRLTSEAARLQGDLSAATSAISRAIALAEDIGSPTQRWRSFAEAAAIARASGDHADAETYRRQSLAVIDDIVRTLLPERRDVFTTANAITALRTT